MKDKIKIAISIGDLNGIGIELALKKHRQINKLCSPIYCINQKMLKQTSKLLDIKIPKDFITQEVNGSFKINTGKTSKKSGQYSYSSFLKAINLAKNNKVEAIVTLPINKKSWNKANISYKGHTEVLRDYFNKNAIMMLGCQKMFVALFTEHISLKEVHKKIKTKKLIQFLLDFYSCIKEKNIAVLGLNPHAGDDGVLGKEEQKIKKAIKYVNKYLNAQVNSIVIKQVNKKLNKKNKEIFFSKPLVPDTAFSKYNLQKYKYFIAMYHDQGLAPLKALYFDESINVSLNLPIIRTSVDHGTAFDIAYKNNRILNTQSYENAVKEAIKLSKKIKH